jgi:hypothetical protein
LDKRAGALTQKVNLPILSKVASTKIESCCSQFFFLP